MAWVREFDGSSLIECAIGGLADVGSAVPVTTVALVRLASNSWRTICSIETDTGLERHGVQVSPQDRVTYVVSPFASSMISTLEATPGDAWAVIIGGKPAGSSTIRVHTHIIDADTWAHEDTATQADPGAAGPDGRLQIGEMNDYEERLHGRAAAIGVWYDTFADGVLEAAGLNIGLTQWMALGAGPAALLKFNQDDATVPVTDVTGGGADQVAITGTTAVDDQDLVFDFDLQDTVAIRSSTGTRSRLAPSTVVTAAVRSTTGTRSTLSADTTVAAAVRSHTATRSRLTIAADVTQLAIHAATTTRSRLAMLVPTTLTIRSTTGTRSAVALPAPIVGQVQISHQARPVVQISHQARPVVDISHTAGSRW